MANVTRQIGSATRIYKNSDDKVLAVDDIAIVSDIHKVGPDKFHRSANKKYTRTLFNLAVGNRTITLVQMIGDYTSIEEDAGDYLTAVWAGDSVSTNDIDISFGDLKKLGESV